MPALNFQKRFAADVESGKKCQTIRAKRKNEIRKGQRLHLYTGQRTKQCRKIGEPECSYVRPVRIDEDTYTISLGGAGIGNTYFGSPDEFARRDGFLGWYDMRDWFRRRYGLPFDGVLIEWAAP